MSELLIQILAGLVVATLSGAGGFFIRKRFFQESRVLPKAYSHIETQSYSHLKGRWHLYWISCNPSGGIEPVWLHGTQVLQIDKNRVQGSTEHIHHPVGDLHFRLQGEIRAGRMIITDTCVEDESDYVSVFYPNLRSPVLLIGIWTGLNNLLRLTAAPAILSRKEMSADDLNSTLKSSDLSLIPIGEYLSHFNLQDIAKP